MRHLLLISSSRVYGSGYLEHCANELQERLEKVERVLFVPYALADHDEYAGIVRSRLAELGLVVDSVHDAADPVAAVAAAEAVFVGGGNTFRLVDALWRRGLIEPLRQRVAAGMPYVGSSAGTNVATPTLKTTNDMPIVQPPTFETLGLVKFQITPTYLDPDPGSRHMGETREERLRQFHEENATPVVGLREGAMLWVDGTRIELRGVSGARVFRRGQAPLELSPGARLDELGLELRSKK